MEPSSNQPNPGQPRELNLQRTAEQFMVGIQKHFDMLAFNQASRQNVTEEAYLEKVNAAGMIPIQKFHQNFEQMQAYARDLMTSQVMNDNLNLAVSCLHQVHLFLVLIRTQKEEGKLTPELQKTAQQEHQKFLQTPIDQKFNLLEEQFGVMAELEDGIMALARAMQAMGRQGGIVKEAQLDETKELTLELKKAPSFSSAQDLGGRLREMETVNKVFREGDKISLSDQELHQLLLATASFAHQMFSHVARYAKDAGAGK
ncbi:MAG: hypothetical protein LAT55_09405 [Opitutales bacterium]|nr:hypothetical protein [Opitutales bacterium]